MIMKEMLDNTWGCISSLTEAQNYNRQHGGTVEYKTADAKSPRVTDRLLDC